MLSNVYAVSSWIQTDWIGGSGQTNWSDTTKYSSSSNIDTSISNQVSLTYTEKFINLSFASGNSGWSTSASAPTGWVEVPGNSTYSTSNFLVMKYEAKCALNSSPTVGLTTPATAGNGYINNTSVGGINCTSANARQVTSLASGYPIVNITQSSVNATYCGAVSVGSTTAHLTTNNEWMTMARNVEAQADNWTLGAVGSGYLFAGGNVDNFRKVASTIDTGNNACAYTDGNPGTESPVGSCPSNTASGQSGTAGNQKRVHILSNGSYIWDLAGNVAEYVTETITQANEPDVLSSTGTITSEFTALTSYGTLSYDFLRPLDSSYDSNFGVGKMTHHSNSASSTVAAIFRGGNSGGTSATGVFATRFDIAPGSSAGSGGIGFRCASSPVNISQTWSAFSGQSGSGGNSVTVGTVSDGLLTQTINVGNTYSYQLSAYVYDNTAGNVGGTVSPSIAQLYANGATVSTTYTDIGSGWWKLSGIATGAASSAKYGLLVKAGKTVITDDFSMNTYGDSGTLTSSIFDIGSSANMGTLTYAATTPTNTSVSVKVRTSDDSTMTGAPAFSSCTAISSSSDISANSCVSDSHRYVQYEVTLSNTDNGVTPTFTNFSLDFSTNAPTTLTGTTASDTSITWSWTDNADDESGFYIQDSGDTTKCTAIPSSGIGSTVNCVETGLNPNTSYTRKVVAYYAGGNSDASNDASAVTHSIAPTSSNITGSQATSIWTNDPAFTFTNTDGFGVGTVEYFRYVFDMSSSYVFTDTEVQWTSSTLNQIATLDSNSMYLHLQGYNSEDVANGTLDLGPYYFDATNPTIPGTPSTTTPTSSTNQTWSWTASTDATSGISNYLWRTTGTAVTSGSTLTNSVNTSLGEGTYNLFIKAVDNAGNESSESLAGTLVVDTSAPTINITDIGLISNVPDQTSLLYYFTVQTPYIQGMTQAGSTVHFKYGSQDYTTTAGSDGKYGISISNPDLPRTTVTLTYYSVDPVGNTSQERTLTLVIGVENFPAGILGGLNPTTVPVTPTPTITTTPVPSPTATVTPTPTSIVSGHKVEIKILDENGQPVVGARVTLYSTPKEAITDDRGLATFTDVEEGDHWVVINYNSRVIEQSVKVSGDTTNQEIVIEIKPVNIFATQEFIIFASIAVIILSVLVFIIIRQKRRGLI